MGILKGLQPVGRPIRSQACGFKPHGEHNFILVVCLDKGGSDEIQGGEKTDGRLSSVALKILLLGAGGTAIEIDAVAVVALFEVSGQLSVPALGRALILVKVEGVLAVSADKLCAQDSASDAVADLGAVGCAG
jgi:hypothetical protein